MDIPTTAVDAARVLVELAHDEPIPRDGPDLAWVTAYNPTPLPRQGDPPPVDTLTARQALIPRDRYDRVHIANGARMRLGVDADLPEVVRVEIAPPSGIGWADVPLVANPLRDADRPIFSVPGLNAVVPRKRPATIRDAHALTLGALSARLAADRVEAWIPELGAGDARRARRELVAYRAYAASAVDLFPSAFAWLDDVDLVPAVAPAPIVSAHLRAGPA